MEEEITTTTTPKPLSNYLAAPGELQRSWVESEKTLNNNIMDLSNQGSVTSEFYTGGKGRSKVSPSGSNNSSSSTFCRICHEGESAETLVAPCHCTGTVALIHRTCLEHWLTSSSSEKCEICKHPYNTAREPRSCVEYVQDSSNKFNVRNLIADIICFFLLTPLLIVSTYLCVIGATQYFMRERWEAIGLIVLALFLIAVYMTWCQVTIKFHFSVWLNWQRTNQRVRLIDIVDCRAERQESLLLPLYTSVQISSSPALENVDVNKIAIIPTTPQSEAEEESICENECDTSRIIV